VEVIKMKKSIVLFIVLLLAGVVNAAIIDVRIASLNGQPITPTKEITIAVGDKVDFQITFNAPNTQYLFNLGVKLNVAGPGTLDWSAFDWPCWWDEENEAWVCADIYYPGFDKDLFTHGYDWVCAGAAILGPRGNGTEYWVVKDIQIQCNGVEDVYLWLSNYAPCGGTIVIDNQYNAVPFQYGPGVIIHQEPACWGCPGQPFGDADGDGFVGSLDLLKLKQSWQKSTGQVGYNCCADFDHDGSVGSLDLLKIQQGWMSVHFSCDNISCP
jgi:hypothetical protein